MNHTYVKRVRSSMADYKTSLYGFMADAKRKHDAETIEAIADETENFSLWLKAFVSRMRAKAEQLRTEEAR